MAICYNSLLYHQVLNFLLKLSKEIQLTILKKVGRSSTAVSRSIPPSPRLVPRRLPYLRGRRPSGKEGPVTSLLRVRNETERCCNFVQQGRSTAPAAVLMPNCLLCYVLTFPAIALHNEYAAAYGPDSPAGYEGYRDPPRSDYFPPDGSFYSEDAGYYAKTPKAKPPVLRMRAASAASAGLVTLGVSKAATGSANTWWAAFGACAAVGMGICGGRAGAAADALGIATLDSAERIHTMEKEGRYPIFKQLKAACHLEHRRRFPPNARDPWRYTPTTSMAPNFSMLQCLIGAAFLGGLSVSLLPSVPFVPSSLCAVAFAIFAMFLVTLDDARGDAARCFVARCIAIVRLLAEASANAELASKTAAALRLGGSHLSALDTKFGISRASGRVARALATFLASRMTPASANSAFDSRRQAPTRSSPPYPDEDLYAAYTSSSQQSSQFYGPPTANQNSSPLSHQAHQSSTSFPYQSPDGDWPR